MKKFVWNWDDNVSAIVHGHTVHTTIMHGHENV